MKKFVRLMAVVLALVMCLCMAAGAADPVASDENTLATIYGMNGATVTFASDGDKEEKITVTYTDADAIKEGGFYLVMMLTGTEDEDGQTVYNPTKGSILYIDQTTGSADHSVSFTVYPSEIKDSAILIYGTDINGEADSLIAAIIDGKQAMYILGDVTLNGVIDSADAMLLLQFVAGLAPLESDQQLAGNVTGGVIDSADAMLLLQVVAGLASLS